MNKKLLQKTTRSFLSLAIIILLISAPIFYFVSHWLFIYEADEVLIFHKEAFLRQSKNFTPADIAIWNNYNPNVKIKVYNGVTRDSIFSTEYYDETSKENEPLRVLWSPVEINGKKYTYIEQSSLVVMEEMIVSIALLFSLVIASLMVGIIWLSKRSAEKIWAPFYDTLHQIKHFEIDKNNPPQFVPTDISEFDTLNKSLDKLIEKNTAIYKTQREFIENAAHELQTPLALFQNRIDTMMQLGTITEEQSVLLEALNSDVSRLNRLNKNLLLLSKIENDNFEKKQIPVNEYLLRNMKFFTEQAASKNLKIATAFKNHLTIDANPTLVEVVINNLFLNAIRHNVQNGLIVIGITKNSLSFSNSGEKSLLSEKMFNRFSKANPSSQGNGLGLAIIKRIAELNRWEISYSFEKNLHHFSIRF